MWKQHPQHRGIEVSVLGEVRNSLTGYKYSLVPDKDGYLEVHTTVDGHRFCRRVNRLVAETHIGPTDGFDVNHIDGNKSNNCVSNLEIVTRRQNNIHSRNVLGVLVGEGHGNSKLTEDSVRFIRSSGLTVGQLAIQLGVDESTVRSVLNRKTWKHVV